MLLAQRLHRIGGPDIGPRPKTIDDRKHRFGYLARGCVICQPNAQALQRETPFAVHAQSRADISDVRSEVLKLSQYIVQATRERLRSRWQLTTTGAVPTQHA